EETGRENFFNRAWFDLLPDQLPAFPAERQMELLAACWNIGENLETRPAWLQHLLLAESSVLETLEGFESRVAAATAEILGEPEGRLDDNPGIRTEWLHLGDYDSRFLPGGVEFLAPGVACVHHRHEDLDGKPKSSIGISLLGEPDVLGTMQVRDPHGATTGGDDPLWQKIAARDRRVTCICSTVRNAWRGVGTLNTSQFVVAVLPDSTAAAEERGTDEGV
ncbi:MAG: hypothetical protein ABEN55_14820, partial [Bradymonadaceae bacterium]